jgi:hypothetical protein
MALNRYVVTADVVIPAGTAATLTPGEPGTGAPAGPGNAATNGGPVWATKILKGTAIVLDPAGPLYSQIGAGSLRPFVDGQDSVSHAATSN